MKFLARRLKKLVGNPRENNMHLLQNVAFAYPKEIIEEPSDCVPRDNLRDGTTHFTCIKDSVQARA